MRLALPAVTILFLSATLAFAQAQRELVVIAQTPDYPPDALAARVEGDIFVRLDIAPDGGLRCTLRAPLGPAMLRRPSCILIAGRWPYGPNPDKSGVPQPTQVDLTVRWKINPDPEMQGRLGGATPISPGSWMNGWDYPFDAIRKKREGSVRVTFDVTERGQMENCAPVEPVPFKVLAKSVCPVLTKRAILLPAIGPDGVRRRSKGSYTVKFAMSE